MSSLIYYNYEWVDYERLISDIRTNLSKEGINFLNLLKKKTKGMVSENDLIFAVHKLSKETWPEDNMLKVRYKVVVLNDLIDYMESATLYSHSYRINNQLFGVDKEVGIPLLNVTDEYDFGRKTRNGKVFHVKKYERKSPRFCMHKPSIHIKYYESWYDDPAKPQYKSSYTGKFYLYIYLPRNLQKNNKNPNYIKQ